MKNNDQTTTPVTTTTTATAPRATFGVKLTSGLKAGVAFPKQDASDKNPAY